MGPNGVYDFSVAEPYFVNTAPPVTSSGLIGGPVGSLSTALGNNASALLLAGMVIGIAGYSYWVRSINR
jgi:hypothetical protein